MELVVDANILMSALIDAEGKTHDLIFNDRVRLFSIDKLLETTEFHSSMMGGQSGICCAQKPLLIRGILSVKNHQS